MFDFNCFQIDFNKSIEEIHKDLDILVKRYGDDKVKEWWKEHNCLFYNGVGNNFFIGAGNLGFLGDVLWFKYNAEKKILNKTNIKFKFAF